MPNPDSNHKNKLVHYVCHEYCLSQEPMYIHKEKLFRSAFNQEMPPSSHLAMNRAIAQA
jgi:hypothetical protein